MTPDTQARLKAIKQSFRLSMNGTASHSMRNKGLNYKINWGIPLHELKVMARDYAPDPHLAAELWKEDIRECKILATCIMPPESMSRELAGEWISEIRTQEMAELIAFNLLRHLDFAPALADELIGSPEVIGQICGYQLRACLFSDGKAPSSESARQLLSHVQTVMEGSDIKLKHAAYNCLLRFCDLGDDYEKTARHALSHLDIL